MSSVIVLILLWGVGWFSALFLIFYVAACRSLIYSLQLAPFSCVISESGKIEVNQPDCYIGLVTPRSFYNGWVLFLCVEITDKLLVKSEQLHNKPRKWFVVFNDSVVEAEYRWLARVIKNTPSR